MAMKTKAQLKGAMEKALEVLKGESPTAKVLEAITLLESALVRKGTDEGPSKIGRKPTLGIPAKSDTKEYRREYYRRNKEKVIASVRKWQLENPDRQRGYAVKSRQLQERELQKVRDGGGLVESTGAGAGAGVEGVKELPKYDESFKDVDE